MFDIETFYQSLNDLSLGASDLDKKRDEIRKVVFSFNDALQRLAPDQKLINRNKKLGKLLTTTVDQIKASGQSWIKNYQEIEEREKFRSELANYFIVIIFGKVKAGKSSLGNFIAKHKLSTQEVNFFKYDEAGKEVEVKELEELDQEGFATNNLECTAEIQGFKIGSLAWIDTPGLGSMTKENGDLAKEYIQAADYIIYPTSSDSPLQKDETDQLKELFAQNKKVTICITKSDDTEEDECECGSESGCQNCDDGIVNVLLNKNADKRQKQEAWVRDEVGKIIPEDKKESLLGDVFSISVHTAKQGLANNNLELYENSNLPIFYDRVTGVLKHKAADLKNSTPYDGLKAFIDKDILGLEGGNSNSISMVKETLVDLDRQINESLERFEALKKNTLNDVKNIVDEVLTTISGEINQGNLQNKLALIDANIEAQVSKEIQNNITKIFSDFEASLDKFTGALDKKYEIKDKYKSVIYTTTDLGKKIGSGLGSIAGGILGLIFGGPMGAAAGSLAGSAVGGAVGSATSSTKTTKVNIGDNKEEVLQDFKNAREKFYEQSVKTVYQQLQDDFFEPLKEVSKTIAIDIKDFEEELENIKGQLDVG